MLVFLMLLLNLLKLPRLAVAVANSVLLLVAAVAFGMSLAAGIY